jgi:hypothetical protein
MAVSECGFVILDCCFILGVEGNSVTEVGGLGVVDEHRYIEQRIGTDCL